MTDKVFNPTTKRYMKVGSQQYNKAVVMGIIKPVEEVKPPPEPTPPEPEFDESKLQEKLADISTDLIKDNLKKVVKAQKLSNDEMDAMLKRMLFKKLCIEEPKKKPKNKEKPAKKKKKAKFRVVSSSESESESSD